VPQLSKHVSTTSWLHLT